MYQFLASFTQLLQRRDNPRRQSMILPALADVHAAAAAPPRRAGGGGKRARLGGAPQLAAIMEGVPSLAEEDDSSSAQQQQQQQQITADTSPMKPASVLKAVIGPDGEVETWDVQQQQQQLQAVSP
jgi:hypothetical protein